MTNNFDDFAGIQFLGARVISYAAQVGWNQDISTCDVGLVEDLSQGDSFLKPDPGTPAFIRVGSAFFGGIVQKWTETHNFNGNPTFKVNLVDPREILAGCEIITDAYSGSTLGLPNIINAYGAYEFGAARTDEIGMPWENIRPVLNQSTFTFINHTYTLDLTEIPQTPNFYRIEGVPKVTVLEAIEQVCNDTGNDFFVELRENNVIRIRLTNRNIESPSAISNIQTFVNLNSEKSPEYEFGKELRNETTSVLLFGHPVQDMYQSTEIEPFWGFDVNGNPILSRYAFTIDIRHLLIGELGATYSTNTDEISLVMGSDQDVWETWLEWKNPSILDKLDVNAPLRIIRDPDLVDINLNPNDPWAQFKGKVALRRSRKKSGQTSPSDQKLQRLFEYLQRFGQEYYGKKFLVKIPPPQRYISSQNEFDITYSLEPVAAGWKESTAWGQPAPLGVPADYEYIFQEPDGKFRPIVRLDSTTPIDLSLINPQKYVYTSTPTYNIFGVQTGSIESIFVEAEVSPDIIQLSNGSQYFSSDPNSILTNFAGISGPPTGAFNLEDFGVVISLEFPITTFNTEYASAFQAVKLFQNQLGPSGNIITATSGASPAASGLSKSERLRQQLLKWGLLQSNNLPAFTLPVIPTQAAIPLQNNQNHYGPWASYSGKNGRVEVIQDLDLNPWNYGNYSYMNLAGQDAVFKASAGQQIVEAGYVVLAGLPERGLGDALLGGQPIITNISVDFSLGGVTTQYQMQTFTRKFGDLGRQRFNQLAKAGRLNRKLNRGFQTLVGNIEKTARRAFATAGWNSATTFMNSLRADAPLDGGSSAFIGGIAGSNHVGVSSFKNVMSNTNVETSGLYKKTGGSSLNSIFRVISTYKDDEDLPIYGKGILNTSGEFIINDDGTLTSGVPQHTLHPNFLDLNPFQSGNDMKIFSGRENFADVYDPTTARPVALRAPLVLAGWGYDIGGNPVPNAASGYPDNPSIEFSSGYLTNPNLWKVGPLDARWDEDRAVWSTNNTVLAVVLTHWGSGGRPIESTQYLPPVSGIGESGMIHTYGIDRFEGGRPRYTCRTAPLFINNERQIMYNTNIPPYCNISGAVDFEVMNIRENAGDFHTLASGSPVLLYTYGNVKFMNEHVRTMIRSSEYQFL